MKTIKYLGMLLAMLALSVSFVNCGSDDDEDGGGNSSSVSVVGRWQAEAGDLYYTLDFYANGTGYLVRYYPNVLVPIRISFEWEQEGNEVWMLTYYDEELEGRLSSSNTLISRDSKGNTVEFKRIKS